MTPSRTSATTRRRKASTTDRATCSWPWKSSRRISLKPCTRTDTRTTSALAIKVSCSAMPLMRLMSACRLLSSWPTSSTSRSLICDDLRSFRGLGLTPRLKYTSIRFLVSLFEHFKPYFNHRYSL